MGIQQHRLTAALAGLPVIAIVALAGCSGGAGPSSAGANAAGAAAAPAGVNHAPAGSAAAGSAAVSSGAVRSGSASSGSVRSGSASSGTGEGAAQPASAREITRTGADLVYTAQLSVRAASVAAAVGRATTIVSAAGGYVSSENDSADPARPDQSSATLGLKIPVAVYPATLARLDSGGLGTQLSLRQQTQDLTQQVADVGSQVTSDEAAIAQLRALLTHAGSVPELLTVQNQVNSEESALESMLAQQKALNDETAYATVTITVLGPKPAAARRAKPAPPPGLVSGLTGGWHAFRLGVDWLLAVAGAAAPFAVVVAVLAFLGYALRRRRSRSA
ncbi:MAG TPA: DUF4349 domain-containing protein [Trebonia sp.]|jgi:hypothetical protein|nr:DUF4349 domain-containing protein [Trebonia sp.]